jgi:hypothetical protein
MSKLFFHNTLFRYPGRLRTSKFHIQSVVTFPICLLGIICCPVWARTRTLMSQNHTCCQLHHGTILVARAGIKPARPKDTRVKIWRGCQFHHLALFASHIYYFNSLVGSECFKFLNIKKPQQLSCQGSKSLYIYLLTIDNRMTAHYVGLLLLLLYVNICIHLYFSSFILLILKSKFNHFAFCFFSDLFFSVLSSEKVLSSPL